MTLFCFPINFYGFAICFDHMRISNRKKRITKFTIKPTEKHYFFLLEILWMRRTTWTRDVKKNCSKIKLGQPVYIAQTPIWWYIHFFLIKNFYSHLFKCCWKPGRHSRNESSSCFMMTSWECSVCVCISCCQITL